MASRLTAEALSARYRGATVDVLRDLDLQVEAGEYVGLSGASGAGKSTLLRLCAGLYGLEGNVEASGMLQYGADLQLLSLPPAAALGFRQNTTSLLTEDPISGLHPQRTVGKLWRQSNFRRNLSDVLAQYGLPPREDFASRYPHQLSGGEAQRIRLAFALEKRPELLLLESPTSALDEGNTGRILDLLATYHKERDTTVLHVDHDHDLLAHLTDRRFQLRNGSIGPPPPIRPLRLSLKPASNELRLRVQNLSIVYGQRGATQAKLITLNNLALHIGETVCLVGPSGSGKTSVGRALARLQPAHGQVSLYRAGRTETISLARHRLDASDTRIQYIFQEPRLAINPKLTVAQTLAHGKRYGLSVEELLRRVALPIELASRRAITLSTGQMQRLTIARALAVRPLVLVCDETTAGLDPVAQQQVLEQLVTAQAVTGLSVLFITHDLAVAKAVGHRVVEMG